MAKNKIRCNVAKLTEVVGNTGRYKIHSITDHMAVPVKEAVNSFTTPEKSTHLSKA